MSQIQNLSAMEILDSRGRPTLKATCVLSDGAVGIASVPSGASTGTAEALELRDADPKRYRGMGCLQAVSHVNTDLNNALVNRTFGSQAELDSALISLDGTPNKSHLGANAVLAVSLAFARAVAAGRQMPLYAYLAELIDQPPRHLPRLTINLFSGGRHAGGQVAIQDVLIVPLASTIAQSLEMADEVYRAAAALVYQRYGMRELKADEGGLAPPFSRSQAMLDDAIAAIEAADLKPGKDMALAVDIAATQFYREDAYHIDGQSLDGNGMIANLLTWLDNYPLVSIEDALAEEDWSHWSRLRTAVGARALVMGDDLLCTNVSRIQKAIDLGAANALLLKVNQIGTLTEAGAALRLARTAGWSVTISARSGETEDNWLADLAVGWNGDFMKIGSIRQSERLAKYNRLLEIEGATSLQMR